MHIEIPSVKFEPVSLFGVSVANPNSISYNNNIVELT
jgi:hypothetical protein